MFEAISGTKNISGKYVVSKLNFSIDKAPAVSVFTKNSASGKQGAINFDWLNIDEKVRENLFNNRNALDKIFGTAKVCCKSPSITEKEREKAIEEEKKHLSKTTTERTAYNTKQLKKAKVPERQIYRYLTYDGHVTFEGKKILKEHGLSYK